MPPCLNQQLAKLLNTWSDAAKDADYTSQQPMTYRKAAKSLATHSTVVTTVEEAVRVSGVGPKLSESIGQWLRFEEQKRAEPLRKVASLRHDVEGKWWTVTLCGTIAWRSWGKRAGGRDGPGLDRWETLESPSEALAWAVNATKKLIAKEYTHAPGSEAVYEAAKAEVPAQNVSSRRGAGAAAAARIAAATGAAGSPPGASAAHATIATGAGSRAAGGDSPASASATSQQAASSAAQSGGAPDGRLRRAYNPKLLGTHGNVSAPAAILLALRRAADEGKGPIPAAEIPTLAQPLCPSVPLDGRWAPGGGGGRGRGGRGARRLERGAMAGALLTLSKNGLLSCETAGRSKVYALTTKAPCTAAAGQQSGWEASAKLAAAHGAYVNMEAGEEKSLSQAGAPAGAACGHGTLGQEASFVLAGIVYNGAAAGAGAGAVAREERTGRAGGRAGAGGARAGGESSTEVDSDGSEIDLSISDRPPGSCSGATSGSVSGAAPASVSSGPGRPVSPSHPRARTFIELTPSSVPPKRPRCGTPPPAPPAETAQAAQPAQPAQGGGRRGGPSRIGTGAAPVDTFSDTDAASEDRPMGDAPTGAPFPVAHPAKAHLSPAAAPPPDTHLNPAARPPAVDILPAYARHSSPLLSSHQLVVVVDAHEKVSREHGAAVVCERLAPYVQQQGAWVTKRALPVGDFLVMAVSREAVAQARARQQAAAACTATGAGAAAGRGALAGEAGGEAGAAVGSANRGGKRGRGRGGRGRGGTSGHAAGASDRAASCGCASGGAASIVNASGGGSGGTNGAGAGSSQNVPAVGSSILDLDERAWEEALVLDTVIERKTVDDFLSTIRDARHYQSQKTRLLRCGLSRPFYLVEGCVDSWNHAAERSRMKLELARIETVDGLLVQRSKSMSDTMAFLAEAVGRLAVAAHARSPAQLASDGMLRMYARFCAETKPPRPRSAEFGAMLLSIDGMTPPTIENLLALYPTARAVCEALEAHRAHCRTLGLLPGAKEEDWLFERILDPGHSRKALSQKLTVFFTARDYPEE